MPFRADRPSVVVVVVVVVTMLVTVVVPGRTRGEFLGTVLEGILGEDLLRDDNPLQRREPAPVVRVAVTGLGIVLPRGDRGDQLVAELVPSEESGFVFLQKETLYRR